MKISVYFAVLRTPCFGASTGIGSGPETLFPTGPWWNWYTQQT